MHLQQKYSRYCTIEIKLSLIKSQSILIILHFVFQDDESRKQHPNKHLFHVLLARNICNLFAVVKKQIYFLTNVELPIFFSTIFIYLYTYTPSMQKYQGSLKCEGRRGLMVVISSIFGKYVMYYPFDKYTYNSKSLAFIIYVNLCI